MLALLLRLGAVLLLTAIFGLGLGVLADAQAGTKPLFTLTFSLAGMVLGTYAGYRLVAAALVAIEAEGELARQARESQQHADGSPTAAAPAQREQSPVVAKGVNARVEPS